MFLTIMGETMCYFRLVCAKNFVLVGRLQYAKRAAGFTVMNMLI